MFSDPVLYHLHHLHETEDVKFWVNLAYQFGGPILELGCGTGRLLSHLTERGHQVIGLDLNYPALAFLRNSVDDELLDRIRIFQSGMDSFHLNENFSMIFLACNTLSTLSMETRKLTYKRIVSHLGPGGVFAASIPNPAYLNELPTQGDLELEDTLTHPATGNPIQVISGWERTNNSVIFRWYYDQLFPDGRVVRDKVETRHHLTSLDEYIAELRLEKLNLIQVFGNYDHSDYGKESPYSILITKKES